MIQRIQTIYFLVTALLSGLLFYISVFEIPSSGEVAAKPFFVNENALLLILNSAIGSLAVITVFLFKKRQLQMKACRLNMLFIFLLVGLLFYTSDIRGLDQKVVYKVGTYIPLIQVALMFLAHRSIKKDDELVRSADRLR